jgi:hypothetical protein
VASSPPSPVLALEPFVPVEGGNGFPGKEKTDAVIEETVWLRKRDRDGGDAGMRNVEDGRAGGAEVRKVIKNLMTGFKNTRNSFRRQ